MVILLIKKRLFSMIRTHILIFISLILILTLGIALNLALAEGYTSLDAAFDAYVKAYGYQDITVTTVGDCSQVDSGTESIEGIQNVTIRRVLDVQQRSKTGC